ncbi:MAG: protein phosphatase 2C domain-containing protein [Gammaproteobacteria bacterium]
MYQEQISGMTTLSFATATHVGNVRDHNEDSYVADDNLKLWLIADGMGGHAGGEIASALAADIVSTGIASGVALDEAIQNAHRAILDAVKNGKGKYGMGTTIVALRMLENSYQLAWVGDSRAYLWSNGLTQISKDHSYVQMLVDLGKILPEEARWHPQKNIITQSLGSEFLDRLMVDVQQGELMPGQKLLLCSDGLSDELDDRMISDIIKAAESDQAAVDALLSAVLENTARDNITVILLSVNA